MIRLSLCPHRVAHLDSARKCSPLLTISRISCSYALEPHCTHTRPRPSGLKGKIKERREGRGGGAKESARGGREGGNGFSIQHQINVGRGLPWPALAHCSSIHPLWSKIIKAHRAALKNCFSCSTGCPTKQVFLDTKSLLLVQCLPDKTVAFKSRM